MLYKTISYYVNLPNFYLLVLSPLGVPLISLWCNTVQWVCRRTIVVGYFATNVVVQDLKIVRLTEGKDLIMSYSNRRSTYISNIVIINDVFQVVIDNNYAEIFWMTSVKSIKMIGTLNEYRTCFEWHQFWVQKYTQYWMSTESIMNKNKLPYYIIGPPSI